MQTYFLLRRGNSQLTPDTGNLDPALHPFAKEREYTRALNATKLGKLFAKPFVAALSGHLDGVYCLRRHVNCGVKYLFYSNIYLSLMK